MSSVIRPFFFNLHTTATTPVNTIRTTYNALKSNPELGKLLTKQVALRTLGACTAALAAYCSYQSMSSWTVSPVDLNPASEPTLNPKSEPSFPSVPVSEELNVHAEKFMPVKSMPESPKSMFENEPSLPVVTSTPEVMASVVADKPIVRLRQKESFADASKAYCNASSVSSNFADSIQSKMKTEFNQPKQQTEHQEEANDGMDDEIYFNESIPTCAAAAPKVFVMPTLDQPKVRLRPRESFAEASKGYCNASAGRPNFLEGIQHKLKTEFSQPKFKAECPKEAYLNESILPFVSSAPENVIPPTLEQHIERMRNSESFAQASKGYCNASPANLYFSEKIQHKLKTDFSQPKAESPKKETYKNESFMPFCEEETSSDESEPVINKSDDFEDMSKKSFQYEFPFQNEEVNHQPVNNNLDETANSLDESEFVSPNFASTVTKACIAATILLGTYAKYQWNKWSNTQAEEALMNAKSSPIPKVVNSGKVEDGISQAIKTNDTKESENNTGLNSTQTSTTVSPITEDNISSKDSKITSDEGESIEDDSSDDKLPETTPKEQPSTKNFELESPTHSSWNEVLVELKDLGEDSDIESETSTHEKLSEKTEADFISEETGQYDSVDANNTLEEENVTENSSLKQKNTKSKLDKNKFKNSSTKPVRQLPNGQTIVNKNINANRFSNNVYASPPRPKSKYQPSSRTLSGITTSYPKSLKRNTENGAAVKNTNSSTTHNLVKANQTNVENTFDSEGSHLIFNDVNEANSTAIVMLNTNNSYQETSFEEFEESVKQNSNPDGSPPRSPKKKTPPNSPLKDVSNMPQPNPVAQVQQQWSPLSMPPQSMLRTEAPKFNIVDIMPLTPISHNEARSKLKKQQEQQQQLSPISHNEARSKLKKQQEQQQQLSPISHNEARSKLKKQQEQQQQLSTMSMNKKSEEAPQDGEWMTHSGKGSFSPKRNLNNKKSPVKNSEDENQASINSSQLSPISSMLSKSRHRAMVDSPASKMDLNAPLSEDGNENDIFSLDVENKS